ncbi:hypothetical protein [Brevibacillus sp. 179-C9.3 HS]|uniref:hypothetical protein n=1 Tax=unclassified Brevibacillus TaxID=2684853 RepID=UPI00399FB44D
MKTVIKLIQIGTFFVFITLGVFKLIDETFKLSIVFGSISLFTSIITVLFSSKSIILESEEIWLQKKLHRTNFLDLLIVIVLIIGIIVSIFLGMQEPAIPSKYGDALSLFALAVSLSNTLLAGIISNILHQTGIWPSSKKMEDRKSA